MSAEPDGGLRKRTRPGTFIPRALLRDERLSFKARGLLCHLLDRPAGWDVRSESLAATSDKDGKLAVQTGLQELARCGYYRLERRNGPGGRFTMGTAISDEPVPEWAADYAEYEGKPVPVIWRDGKWLVKHKDGSLTPDGFDGYEDADYQPEPQDPGGTTLTGQHNIDGGESSQVTPEIGFPAPENPAPENPAPGESGAGKPIALSRTEKEEPKRSSRYVSATQPHNGRGGDGDGSQATARQPRRRAERSDAEQAQWDQADEIARTWWDSWKARGVTIVGAKFPGFRQNTVLAALKAGADPEHVRRALVACGEPFPSAGRFQQALAAIQDPASAQSRTTGRGARPGPWRDQTVTTEEHARLAAQFDGVSVNGTRTR